MTAQAYEIGVVGLGVMGRNLMLNMADHGHAVAGLDRSADAVEALHTEGAGKQIAGTTSAAEFVGMLRRPRAIILLVPAGPVVDAVVGELRPLLAKGDAIIDSGNSHFQDTDRRVKELAGQGLHFAGMGISGGEKGARYGPSMMPGGAPEVYEIVRPVLEDVAAKVGGEPCVAYLGRGSAGHFVKMVHNGIEYGLMQILAETYDLMRRGLQMDNDQMHAVFDAWNRGSLASYLVEITAKILLQKDEHSDQRLVDVILDVARQKGTGKWTSQDAMDLQSPTLTIDAAVSLRDMSGYHAERQQASKLFPGPDPVYQGDRKQLLEQLQSAVHAAMIITYAQGMAMLRKASSVYNYNLDLETVARIWRGGCIIRAAHLEELRAAFRARPDLANPLLDPGIARAVAERQAALRAVVCTLNQLGIPGAALSACLDYLDAYRCARLPANLTQAQRDFFGAHTYERIDEPGVFHHTKWE